MCACNLNIFSLLPGEEEAPGIPTHARRNRRGKNGRRDVPAATALGNHLCGAPVAEGRRRPDRQTDPRWQATHLGGSGSSRAGNSLTLFIPAILVSPPSPRSFRHNRVDTLRSSRQCAPLPLLLLFRTFNQSVVKRLTT